MDSLPSQVPARVVVPQGGEALVELPGWTGAGHLWSMEMEVQPGSPIASGEIRTTRSPPSLPDPPAGAAPPPSAGPEVRLLIRGLRPGTAACRLVLARPFGDDPPLAEHTVIVEVTQR